MKNFRSSLAVILVLFIFLSIFVGCEKNNNQINNNKENKNDSTSKNEDDKNEKTENEKEKTETNGGNEEMLEEVTLKWYLLISEQKDMKEVFDQVSGYTNEQINADLEIVTLSYGNYQDKVNAAISAGEEIDLMWTASWMGAASFENLYQKGGLLPLDNLLTTYAKETYKYIDNKFWDLLKREGEIYGVPNYQIMARQRGLWFSKALVDKYNFDYKNMSSYKDLEPFFDSILENEEGITPIVYKTGTLETFEGDLGPQKVFGYEKGRSRQIINMGYVFEDDVSRVVDPINDMNFRNYLFNITNEAHEWYSKGYIREDVLSIQNADSEIKAGRFASGFTSIKPGGEAELTEKYGFEVVTLPITSPILNAVDATLQSIPSTSKNPERAMMLIEMLNTDKKLFNLLANGLEGKHYVMDGENRIKRVENNGYQPNMDWVIGNTTLGYLTPGKTDNVHQLTKELNDAALPELLADFHFQKENVKNQSAAFDNVIFELGNPIISGVKDPEIYFDEFIEAIQKAGALKIYDEIQNQLDAYLK